MVVAPEHLSIQENPELGTRLEWTIQMVDDLFLALEDKVDETGLVNPQGKEIWRERYLERFVETIRQTRDKITSDAGVRTFKKDYVVDVPGLFAGAHCMGQDNKDLIVTVTRGENSMVLDCKNPEEAKIDADIRITAEGVARVLKIGGGELLYAKKIPEPNRVLKITP
ncbi:MAG: hypothetical protein Q7S79_02735 [bacterium]|nr:hypothetical protein [bacterium]